MAPAHVHAVLRGVFLIELHIRQKPRADIAPFQKVMAQNAVFGKTVSEHPFKGIHVVYALADEGPFTEKILIDVGYGSRVGVYSRVRSPESFVPGPVRKGEADRHPGLKDSVPPGDSAEGFIVVRPVQRMGHGCGELAGSIPGQLGIRIEGEDVLHLSENRDVTDDDGKGIPSSASQKGVEFSKLAPLPFIPHPDPLKGVPPAGAMKKIEKTSRRGGVFPVQALYSLPGKEDKGVILRKDLLGRVGQIRHKGEGNMVIPVRQKADLEIAQQIVYPLRVRQHRGDGDEGPFVRRNPLGVVHPGQLHRAGHEGCKGVHQGYGGVSSPEKDQNKGKGRKDGGCSSGDPPQEEGEGRKDRKQEDRPYIEGQGYFCAGRAEDIPQGGFDLSSFFQGREPIVHEIIPHVGSGIFRPIPGSSLPGKVNGLPGYLRLSEGAVFCGPLNPVAVIVPGGEIHAAVDPGGVLRKGMLHGAHSLHEVPPVEGAEEAEAADAVGHGDLVYRLFLVLRADELLYGQPRFGEAMGDPVEGEAEGRPLSLEAPGEFRHERACHGGIRPGHVGDGQDDVFRIPGRHLHHLVGPESRPDPVLPGCSDPLRHPAEILDEGKAEHDRDSPEFSEFEGGDRKIGLYKGVEVFRVDPAVAMGDGLQGDVVDPGEPRRWAIVEIGKPPAVPLGKMAAGRPGLFLDKVKVIKEPFTRRGNPPGLPDVLGKEVSDLPEKLFVLPEADKQAVAGMAGAQFMGGGHNPPVLFHLHKAEELRPEGEV